MLDRSPYYRKSTRASTWILKALGLVIAGAATVMVAMTIGKNVSTKADAAPGGKFVGIRHEAAPLSTVANTTPSVTYSTPASGQPVESSTGTVVRNGVTVLSPQLLVPVIDMDALRTATEQTEASSSKASSPRKRYHYASRSRSTHHPRWKAFGLALR